VFQVIDYNLILQDVGVPKDQTDDCMAWAFGEDWKEISPNQESMFRWNMRHGNLFRLSGTDKIPDGLKMIGIAYVGEKEEHYINLASLYDLNKSEENFRKALVKSFLQAGVKDTNEMMDCLSWGLNYDKELLRCHTYSDWPQAFKVNAGIDVQSTDSVESCIAKLVTKWKSKPKIFIPRGLGKINEG